MSISPARQPAGSPTGGQFAATTRAEATFDLEPEIPGLPPTKPLNLDTKKGQMEAYQTLPAYWSPAPKLTAIPQWARESVASKVLLRQPKGKQETASILKNLDAYWTPEGRYRVFCKDLRTIITDLPSITEHTRMPALNAEIVPPSFR